MTFSRSPLRILILSLLGAAPVLLAAQAPNPAMPEKLKRADAAFHAGYAALQSGNLEEAKTQFAQAVRLAPQIPEGHEALGDVLLELGKPADAVRELETALQLKPGDQGMEANLARAYVKVGDSGRAVQHFSAAYQASQQTGAQPVDADFCQAYGRALAATGSLDQAILMYQAAADRGLATPELFDAIGSLYAHSANWAEAEPQFLRALAIDSAYLPARIHLGIVQREQRDLEGALDSLKAAVNEAATSAFAQSEYGRTLEAAGQDDAAVSHLQEAVKLDPNLPGGQDELAKTFQRLGRQQEAIPWFQQALQRDPHNVSTMINLGLALTFTGKAKDGLTYFQQALAAAPPDATVYKDQGVAHIQLASFDEAIADFKAALALDPGDPQLHYDLGMAYKLKDRMDDAIAELTQASQMDPTLQDPPYTLGILYMQIGKLDEAVVELRKAVTLRPDSGDGWAMLGSVLKQDSRLDEAREALEKAIPLLPGQPGPRVTLAGVLAEQAGAASEAADAAQAAGDQQKADQLLAQVKDLRARVAELRRQAAELSRSAVNRQKASFAMNAGNQLLLRGQIADAVARYLEAIAADPTFADPHQQLALAYERMGRATEAAAERAKATTLAPVK